MINPVISFIDVIDNAIVIPSLSSGAPHSTVPDAIAACKTWWHTDATVDITQLGKMQYRIYVKLENAIS